MAAQDHGRARGGRAARGGAPEAAGSPQLVTLPPPAASHRAHKPTPRPNGCPSGTLGARGRRPEPRRARRARRAPALLLLACAVRGCGAALAPDVAKRQRNMSLHFTAGQCAVSR